MRRPAAVAGILLPAVLLASCASASGDDQAGAPDGLSVVVTTTILGDVVRGIVGDAGTVEVLMAPGQDPHGFAASARQAQQIREASLVVANGLGLEEAMHDDLEAAEAAGVEVLHVAEHVDPLEIGEDPVEHEGEGEEGHGHGGEDPHVWLDPVRMAEGARVISASLAEVDDTLDDATWIDRGEEVAADLEALDDEVAGILAEVPEACRLLVTNHDSLGYLAARYDLEVVGSVVPGTSTQAEPSAQEFATLAGVLRDAGVGAIFAETTVSHRLADSLAAEVGRDVQVVELYSDSLGEPGSGAETYAGLLRTDAQLIADALAAC